MAYINTKKDEGNYLFYVVEIRTLHGECLLKIGNLEYLLYMIYNLLKGEKVVQITDSNKLGKKIADKLINRGFIIRSI